MFFDYLICKDCFGFVSKKELFCFVSNLLNFGGQIHSILYQSGFQLLPFSEPPFPRLSRHNCRLPLLHNQRRACPRSLPPVNMASTVCRFGRLFLKKNTGFQAHRSGLQCEGTARMIMSRNAVSSTSGGISPKPVKVGWFVFHLSIMA